MHPAEHIETLAEALKATSGRTRRLTLFLPRDLAAHLADRAAERGRTYAMVALEALRNQLHHLPRQEPPTPTAEAADEGILPPPRAARGRRRNVAGVPVALYLTDAERAALERAVAEGRAGSISDLVTRVLRLQFD